MPNNQELSSAALNGNPDSADRLARMAELCGHLDHLLSEALDLASGAACQSQGSAKDQAGRASASIAIAMEFREQLIEHVEALQAA